MSKGKLIVIRLRIFLILFFACSVTSALAQAKPKRDKSKDITLKVAKAQSKKKKAITVKVANPVSSNIATRITLTSKVHKIELAKKESYNIKKTSRRRKRRSQYLSKKATYLTVDGFINPTKREYSYSPGGYKFPVRTDGKNWYIVNSDPWCQAYKKSNNELILYVGQNESHKERRSWFNVVCDNQSVTVEVIQQGKPIYAAATINNVDIFHNVDNLWIQANVNFTVSGASNLHCIVIGYVRDEDGNLLRDQNGYGGLLSFTSQTLVPTTDGYFTQTLTMNLPKYKLPFIKGKHRYTLEFNIYCSEIKKNINTFPYQVNFYAKAKNHKIITFGSEH